MSETVINRFQTLKLPEPVFRIYYNTLFMSIKVLEITFVRFHFHQATLLYYRQCMSF